jgi:antitoxin component of MazEF toxin-antitoxin module
MRLQKQLSRKVGNKEYAKYVAVIPPKIVKEVRLKEGDELTMRVENKKIIIEKK